MVSEIEYLKGEIGEIKSDIKSMAECIQELTKSQIRLECVAVTNESFFKRVIESIEQTQVIREELITKICEAEDRCRASDEGLDKRIRELEHTNRILKWISGTIGTILVGWGTKLADLW